MNTSTLPHPPSGRIPRPSYPVRRYWSMLYGGRRLIVCTALAGALAGGLYALFAAPVYRSDILFQVEQSQTDSKQTSPPGDPSSVFDLKTDASTEIEVLKSRAVLDRAIESTNLALDARPHYLPLIGWRLVNAADGLSSPLPGGYVYGTERIDVPTFDVPKRLLGKRFALTVGDDGAYTLQRTGFFGRKGPVWRGRIGQPLHIETPQGPIDVFVRDVAGQPGARFDLTRYSDEEATTWLQKNALISERGKQSNMIGVTLDGIDPVHDSRVLNAIGEAYLAQNTQRKSEAADKLIRYMDGQLPQLKAQLEAAENRFNAFRASHGTVNTSDEALALRQQSVDIETRVQTLQQRREELLTRFMPKHPAIVAVDAQLADAQRSLDTARKQIQQLPTVEQGVLQLQRDVAVDTALYTNLLNTRQQMVLARASKTGTVRIVDTAKVAEQPIGPHRGVAVVGLLMVGLLAGAAIVIARQRVVGTIGDAEEIEWATGLPVFATVPHSAVAAAAEPRSKRGRLGPRMSTAPINVQDAALESLRSFRASLQLSMPAASNPVVLISGPTTGVGKSFVAANIASLVGAAKRRVLLIDADLRKGSLHDRFRYSRAPGLADVVAGTHTLDEAIRRGVAPGLDFIAMGHVVPDPGELLLQPALAELIGQAASRYDMVVLDGPPLLPVADALVLGRLAGTVFLVARSGVTTLTELDESARRLEHAHIDVRGVILNDYKGAPGRYDYGYTGANTHQAEAGLTGMIAPRQRAERAS
ncbi:polysaccharide biosynthesis tyrosine autokinase [Burkholderia sp. BCCIQ04A]|uniref:Polysaccharide biosynthesis tyrosine autokinase n=1 Tax=Burkholderia anthinoferrum TaxID=3090833 RepID=A0ABU5WPI5_9BURK|nr:MULTISPECIES: polysaccharide biosynthesis tyrosine autokinase [Burkholderia]MEB2505006.1 polysaccharide biosynthesis tyrosine autokinase [Burkholderia anthinoferrum]MEB2531814.1 polysaccharide biosynthesis tyrosine autokinase [Burkholderia anthinoferrum]MEB2563729.1 polysaccharide biosynthesis tyrosine autokinase [Burkholderia anthinoferrum]MEB2580838.1 polysaccharide biosynthesis tyrosine autokinase [Burkholderia anthinoferrum]MCA8107393.1 polysaccharide biosynthesis tyrosine autokinase [B